MEQTLDPSLLSLLHQFQILEYLQICLHVVFLYDYIQLLPKEIEYIWKVKGPKINIPYFICRYTAFFTVATTIISTTHLAIDDKPCLVMGFCSAWITLVGMLAAQLVFVLRTYALWGASRSIAYFLGFLALAMTAEGITINALIMRSTTLFLPPVKDATVIPQCFLIVEGQPKFAMMGVFVSLIIDMILMFLVILAKIKRFRLDHSPFVRRVYRDAVIYFVLNLFASMIAIILYFKPPGPLKQLAGIFSDITYRILSSHVMIRLREQGKQDTATTLTSVSALHFRHDDTVGARSAEVNGARMWEGLKYVQGLSQSDRRGVWGQGKA